MPIAALFGAIVNKNAACQCKIMAVGHFNVIDIRLLEEAFHRNYLVVVMDNRICCTGRIAFKVSLAECLQPKQ